MYCQPGPFLDESHGVLYFELHSTLLHEQLNCINKIWKVKAAIVQFYCMIYISKMFYSLDQNGIIILSSNSHPIFTLPSKITKNRGQQNPNFNTITNSTKSPTPSSSNYKQLWCQWQKCIDSFWKKAPWQLWPWTRRTMSSYFHPVIPWKIKSWKIFYFKTKILFMYDIMQLLHKKIFIPLPPIW